MKRNYGIDLLRIMSMLGVVGLHILNAGGILTSSLLTEPGRIWVHGLYYLMVCSVNVFAMISGYLYVQKTKIRSRNIVQLSATCIFYWVLIALAFILLLPGSVTAENYLHSFFPPQNDLNWYIVCYFLLFFLAPILNDVLRSLSRKRLQVLILWLFVLLCAVPYIGNVDYFRTNWGYSPWWLMYCYIVGGYLELHGLPWRRKPLLLAGNIALAMLAWYFIPGRATGILEYTSPFVVAEAVLLLAIFEGVKIPGGLHKGIRFLSGCGFGVYIIHAHPLVMEHCIAGRFGFLTRYSIGGCLAGVLVTAAGIYLLCSVVESGKAALFRLPPVKRGLDAIGDKMDKILDS